MPILLILLTLPSLLFAYPGECALDFLNIPIGAQGASLGHGGFARIEGPQALFYNPSLIGETTAGFVSYQRLLLDTRSEAVAVGIPVGERLSAGFGIHAFQPGDIDGYSAGDVNIGNIKSGDYLMRFSLARAGEISYGVSFSYYSHRLDDQIGNGVGIGFGISREFRQGRLSVTADNFGPDFKIGAGSAPLPQRYSVSAWLPLTRHYMNIIIDLTYKLNIGFRPSGGLEYSPLSGFAIRAGTNSETPLALGLGMNRGGIGLDYSYFPSGVFGERHIFSFTVSK
ncbi:MAG: hypothetical protein V3W18_06860 [candidate division Zixibacteria bacterium]